MSRVALHNLISPTHAHAVMEYLLVGYVCTHTHTDSKSECFGSLQAVAAVNKGQPCRRLGLGVKSAPRMDPWTLG